MKVITDSILAFGAAYYSADHNAAQEAAQQIQNAAQQVTTTDPIMNQVVVPLLCAVIAPVVKELLFLAVQVLKEKIKIYLNKKQDETKK
jgi:hypothetical protein